MFVVCCGCKVREVDGVRDGEAKVGYKTYEVCLFYS